MSDSSSADLRTSALRELHAVGRWSKTPTLAFEGVMPMRTQRFIEEVSDSASADLVRP